MSYIDIPKEIFTQDLNDSEIIFYIILLFHNNSRTKQCNPSQKFIKKNYNLSESTQVRVSQKLQDLKIISKISSFETSNQYDLLLPKSDTIQLLVNTFHKFPTQITYQNIIFYLKLQLLKPRKLKNTNQQLLLSLLDYSLPTIGLQLEQLQNAKLITLKKLHHYNVQIIIN